MTHALQEIVDHIMVFIRANSSQTGRVAEARSCYLRKRSQLIPRPALFNIHAAWGHFTSQVGCYLNINIIFIFRRSWITFSINGEKDYKCNGGICKLHILAKSSLFLGPFGCQTSYSSIFSRMSFSGTRHFYESLYHFRGWIVNGCTLSAFLSFCTILKLLGCVYQLRVY